MRNTPKVSLIIPVYNLNEIISSCLNSCINQTFKDLEIIVVNDGSNKETTDLIENFIKKDQRIKQIKKEKNEGLPFARKTGLENSTGDYVFHLDGDDTIPENSIEILFEKAIEHSAEIVAGSIKLFRAGSIEKVREYSSFGKETGEAFLEFILKNNLHYLCGKLIHRSLYENNIEIKKEITIGEDQVQMYQLCLFAKKVVTIDTCVYNYILNDFSVTQRKTENNVFSKQQEHYAMGLNELKEKYIYNNFTKQQLNLRILRALYLSLHRSGRFELNGSMSLLKHTMIQGTFTFPSLLTKNFSLFVRCIISLFSPSFFFYIKGLIKS